jgi:predicted O-methyltransferase YrrM
MAIRNKLNKIITIIGAARRHGHDIKMGVDHIYDDIIRADSPILSETVLELLGQKSSVTLENWAPVDGNVLLEELVFLCALAQKMQPSRIVEIGTFDGNTALQLALNTPPETRIFTLDLEVGVQGLPENDASDLKYIASESRIRRRFLGTAVEHKVIQCYGNSLTYDFAGFAADGNPQFIFIDAGHSYKCVRNDTERALSILDRGGVIVWHDYSIFWPDVYRYLVELSRNLRLIHVTGTQLVVYRSPA